MAGRFYWFSYPVELFLSMVKIGPLDLMEQNSDSMSVPNISGRRFAKLSRSVNLVARQYALYWLPRDAKTENPV